MQNVAQRLTKCELNILAINEALKMDFKSIITKTNERVLEKDGKNMSFLARPQKVEILWSLYAKQ